VPCGRLKLDSESGNDFAPRRTNNKILIIMRYVLITGFLTRYILPSNYETVRLMGLYSACSLSALITVSVAVYSCPNLLTLATFFFLKYFIMPHNMIFIGIDFLLPNCA